MLRPHLPALLLALTAGCAPKTGPVSQPLATAAEPTTSTPATPEPTPPQEPGKPQQSGLLDAAQWLPAEATLLFGVDLAKTLQTELGQFALDEFRDPVSFKESLEAAETCKVGPETWQFLLVGTNVNSNNENAAVVSAKGLGTEPVLRCLLEQSRGQQSDPGSLALEDGHWIARNPTGTIAIALSDDMLLVADDGWASLAEERVRGSLPSAAEGKLQPALEFIHEQTPAFMTMVGLETEGVGSFAWMTVELGLERRLDVHTVLHYDDETGAEGHAQALKQQFEQVRGMASMFGIPAEVVESIRFDTMGPRVRVSGHASVTVVKDVVASTRKSVSGTPSEQP